MILPEKNWTIKTTFMKMINQILHVVSANKWVYMSWMVVSLDMYLRPAETDRCSIILYLAVHVVYTSQSKISVDSSLIRNY